MWSLSRKGIGLVPQIVGTHKKIRPYFVGGLLLPIHAESCIGIVWRGCLQMNPSIHREVSESGQSSRLWLLAPLINVAAVTCCCIDIDLDLTATHFKYSLNDDWIFWLSRDCRRRSITSIVCPMCKVPYYGHPRPISQTVNARKWTKFSRRPSVEPTTKYFAPNLDLNSFRRTNPRF